MTYVNTTIPQTITIPAPTFVVSRGMIAVAVKMDTWATRRSTRKALRNMPEHILFDVGLTREQAQTEAAKYFWRA